MQVSGDKIEGERRDIQSNSGKKIRDFESGGIVGFECKQIIEP